MEGLTGFQGGKFQQGSWEGCCERGGRARTGITRVRWVVEPFALWFYLTVKSPLHGEGLFGWFTGDSPKAGVGWAFSSKRGDPVVGR